MEKEEEGGHLHREEHSAHNTAIDKWRAVARGLKVAKVVFFASNTGKTRDLIEAVASHTSRHCIIHMPKHVIVCVCAIDKQLYTLTILIRFPASFESFLTAGSKFFHTPLECHRVRGGGGAV